VNDQSRQRQQTLCEQYGVHPVACGNELRVGISRNVRDGALPIHGIRISPVGEESGWFIWRGEYSDAADFFVPLHVGHLRDWCPAVRPFLLLPPKWRFQIAPGYEDAWLDPQITLDWK